MREVRGRMEDGCFVLYVSLHAAPVDAQCSSTKLPIDAVPPFPAAPNKPHPKLETQTDELHQTC